VAYLESCSKCVELWKEYGILTRAHVELLRQQEQCVGRNLERFRFLDPMIEVAAKLRDGARSALKAHLAEDHPEQQKQEA
jgi:hypothetical protein